MRAKDSRKMTSIARRINRHHVADLFWTLVFVNITILAILLTVWCYTAEKGTLGHQWIPNLLRSIEWTQNKSFSDTLPTVYYIFSLPQGEAYRVYAGTQLMVLYRASFFIAILEGLTLVFRWRKGKGQTMNLLSPLHKMSETAEQLSRAGFDEQKYHDLEDAIEAISASAPDAKLSTGDSDLLGLENAVNNLLTRMHENYRHQIRFVSDASHELRTPISVIRGYAEMLDRWGKDDKKILEEGITAIRIETDNMQQLVEQLLFLARGDAGRHQPQLQAIDLSKLVHELYDEYAMIDQNHHWRIQTEASVSADADPAQLKQAARILCDNALKYSGTDSVITLRSFVNEHDEPCFSVQDSGVGISSADIPHIFERFYRADPARNRNSGGTGLGLSIAKLIIDRHKGYFKVISLEGVGTRMVVCLPKKIKPKDTLIPETLMTEADKSDKHSES
ncbi:MAG: sensor histidine kinase [Clostridiales bacterium]|nr:sensor histidine kinase [Clostridiales bacterium]